MPFRRLALALATLAALHGLVYVPFVSGHVKTDSWSYVASANAIRDASYTTPLKAGFYYVYPVGWFDITGARVPRRVWQEPERQAFRPPGYPLYLALFGRKPVLDGEHTPALVGQALLVGATAYLLILLARRWFGTRTAIVAGAVFAADPWSKHYVPLVLSEPLAGLAVTAAAYAYTRAWDAPGVPAWLATGALAAAASLVRAVFVVAVALAVLGALLLRASPRRRFAHALAAALGAAVLLVPWLAWTNHVAARATMSVWGEGYNLILAASGEGHGQTSAEVEREPAFRARMEAVRDTLPDARALASDSTAHPRYLARADERLRRDAQELYRDRLVDEPLRVAWETAYRMWFLWAAHKDWYQPGGAALAALIGLDWVVLVLALVGSAVAFARGGAARGVALFLAAYTLVLGTHHVEARFAIPLRGVYLALACFGALELVRLSRLRRAHE